MTKFNLSNLMNLIYGSLACLVILSLVSCRGQISKEAPIHLNPNMDQQEKFKAYSENNLFEDKRSMRPLPTGTVPRGHLNEDEAFYQGSIKGEFVNNPLPFTQKLLERGQDRYDIYCSMCHGATGLGGGIVIEKGYVVPPSYDDERVINLKDGEIYHVINNGIRNMPSYGKQIPVEDRWAIVAYVRALQRAQTASLKDVPDEKRGELN